MKSMMIVYESRYGQTQKIAHHIADLARARGHEVHIAHVAEAHGDQLDMSDAFVVLAPVFVGHHPRLVYDFVLRHSGLFRGKPTAFFSVCGAAASKNPADRATARKIATDFLISTGWRATVMDVFAGAIAYPEYNWLVRLFMRQIAKREGNPLDTSKTHELTDWAVVNRAASHFVDIVEGRIEEAVA